MQSLRTEAETQKEVTRIHQGQIAIHILLRLHNQNKNETKINQDSVKKVFNLFCWSSCLLDRIYALQEMYFM